MEYAGKGAFSFCPNLETIMISEENRYFEFDNNGLLFKKEPKTLYKYPAGRSESTYVISNSVNEIKDYAFDGCTYLTKVTIGSGVDTIGKSPFSGCTGLESIEVDEGNSNFISTQGVLFDKNKKTLIQYPAGNPSESYVVPDTVTTIQERAFSNCNSLTHLTLGKEVNSMGNVFENCKSLTTIDAVESNTNYAFSDGVLFTKDRTILVKYPSGKTDRSYAVPNSVTNIANGAFEHCENLVYVSLGDSLSSWPGFSNCPNLVSVTIPESVPTISGFDNCDRLTKVFFQGVSGDSTSYYLSEYPSLKTVCVSPDYPSLVLYGARVTSSSTECQSFQAMFDKCSQGTYLDGVVQREPRKAAREWADMGYGCVHYVCNKDTGELSIDPSCERACFIGKCDQVNGECSFQPLEGYEEPVAKGNECVEGKEVDMSFYVEIELSKKTNETEIDPDDLERRLREECGFGPERIAIGWKKDEYGYVTHLFIYAENAKTAEEIAKFMRGIDQGEGCKYGEHVFCRVLSIRLTAWQRVLSKAYHTLPTLVFVVALFATVLYESY